MKKLLFAITAMALSAGVFAQAKADDIAKIKMETIDLGKIPQGIPAVSTFIVTNIGKTDLIIESANPTCGCTVGDYTKSPIKPGQTGTITATFNAAAVGPIDKHMNVKFAGADDTKSIGFKGEVLTSEDYAKLKGEKVPATTVAVKNTVAAPAKANAPSTKVTKKSKKVKTVKATTVAS
ncbi:MAG: DUF1573 domain-containing protein [Ferruginibacter sp.]|nr:DUF1573 domain-containing protein [Ferruginibacter sp.]